MSSAIGPGSWVEKVGDSITSPMVADKAVRRVVGLSPVYTEPCPCCQRMHQDLIIGGEPGQWCVEAWRPISGGERGMFDHMLKAPTDAPNKEPVEA